MIKKNLRLFSRAEISKVFWGGSFLSAGPLRLKFRQNGRKLTRLGVFVGVKYSKKAVERNRVRRRIWAILEKKYNFLKKGFDIAVIPSQKSFFEKVSPDKLSELIQNSLEKGGLFEK
jgi:ribonuclease P protein component